MSRCWVIYIYIYIYIYNIYNIYINIYIYIIIILIIYYKCYDECNYKEHCLRKPYILRAWQITILHHFLQNLGKRWNRIWIQNILNKNDLYPAGSYMFKVDNRNTRTRCEIWSKLIKAPERCQWHRFGVFIVNFGHISQLVLLFLLSTLSRQMPAR